MCLNTKKKWIFAICDFLYYKELNEKIKNKYFIESSGTIVSPSTETSKEETKPVFREKHEFEYQVISVLVAFFVFFRHSEL